MEDFRKLAKIAALNQKIPGSVCGNPDCEDLCAEVYDAALSLRLDPAVTTRKTVERSLHCLPANAGAVRSCRFGFVPASDSLVLGGDKKKKGDNEVIHIFRTGINECKKCQALGGTRIFPDVWVNEEKMKDWGFWKQENGEYLPHPNCKCHWAEKIKSNDAEEEKTDFKRTAEPSIISDKKHIEPKLKVIDASTPENIESSVAVGKNPGVVKIATPKEIVETKNNPEKSKYADLLPHTYGLSQESASSQDRYQANMYNTRLRPDELHRLTFHTKNQGFLGLNPLILGDGIESVEDMVRQIEAKKYRPHSIISITIIGHGSHNTFPMGKSEQGVESTIHDFKGKLVDRLKFYLHQDCVIEFRFCKAAEGESGKNIAQDFANKVGCDVIAYEGPVNPNGKSPIYTPRDEDEMDEPWTSRLFLDPKPQIFHPKSLEKQKK